MSIPKEPRQLMINLMYLVLTAMLALSASAEIFNAFFKLDKGNVNSSQIVTDGNSKIIAGINKQADAYKNPMNEKYRENSQTAQTIVEEFVAYVDGIRTTLITESGGMSEEDPNKPAGYKNQEVTSRLLVGEAPNYDAKGKELKTKIDETRAQLLGLIAEEDRAKFENSLPLKTEPIPEGTEKKSWAAYNFYQMPVAAVLPMLSKYQVDAKSSATALLNYFLEKVGGEDIKFDAFEPVVSATKGYVIRGEKYDAEVFLSAYSKQSSGNISISVDGRSLPVKSGKASYTATPSSTGVKKYNVKINVKNPLTKEVKSYSKTFEYEVGERSVTVAADKMNVFYVGVDNPVSVSAAGISSNELKVSASGCTITKKSKGKYVVTASKPNLNASITVSGGGLKATKFPYRVKRIPDPKALLGNNPDGTIANGVFKAQRGVVAKLENFDFDARCNIQGFSLVYHAKRQDPIPVTNRGGKFSPEAVRLIKKAKPGDTYYFDNVKARCPGDAAGRKINSMVFKIK